MGLQLLQGEWGLESGGCPKHPTWANNPVVSLSMPSDMTQDQIVTLTLSTDIQHRIGLLVHAFLNHGSSSPLGESLGPKPQKKNVIFCSKFKDVNRCEFNITCQPNQTVLLIPSTYDPNIAGHFTIQTSTGSLKLVSSVSAKMGTAPTMALRDGSVVVDREGGGTSAAGLKEECDVLVNMALEQCAKTGRKFEDAEFEASASSLWSNGSSPGAELGIASDPVTSWRRPDEISDGVASLFKNDWEIEGVVAGALPNVWFSAALNILGASQEVVRKSFVDSSHSAEGFYVVRLFEEDIISGSDWKLILVDDRLPCDFDGRPCFVRNPSVHVLWAAILEKALAKSRGTYEATCLAGGTIIEGLMLLSGGLTQGEDIEEQPEEIVWSTLMGHVDDESCVIGCEFATRGLGGEARQGILPDTPYAVATMASLESVGRLVKLRALHGAPEWQGKWCDTDPGWTSRLRSSLNFAKNSNDGSFWMSFSDWSQHFNKILVCRSVNEQWCKLSARSQWSDRQAGGCPNFVSWRRNPQWLIRVPQGSVSATISVTIPHDPKSASYGIGFYLLKGNVNPADQKRRKITLAMEDIVAQPQPEVTRQVSQEVVLQASTTPYALVPYCFFPNQDSPFAVSVRFQGDPNSVEMFPVAVEEDWVTGYYEAQWRNSAHGGGPPGSEDFHRNPTIPWLVKEAGDFTICIETTGIEAVEHDGDSWPTLGLALRTPTGETINLGAPLKEHGLVSTCASEASSEPYQIVPYLYENQPAATWPDAGFRIVIYSASKFTFGQQEVVKKHDHHHGPSKLDCSCEFCCICGKNCSMFWVLNRLRKIEEGLNINMNQLGLATQGYSALGLS